MKKNIIQGAAPLIQAAEDKSRAQAEAVSKSHTLPICLPCGPHRHRHRRRHRHPSRKMSKKNKRSTRVKQHVFDLKREKEEQEKKAKKAEKQKIKAEKKKIKAEDSMKIDSGISKIGKQIKKKSFKVGKTRKFQLDATTKAKAAQAMAMEIEK